jgi:glycosyltransferase involved in cell wall biosynthesis
MNVLVVTSVAPENPTNGGHLRRWNLLNGEADILCLYRESISEELLPPGGSLRWRRIRVLERVRPICEITRIGNQPVAFSLKHRALALELSAAIAEYRSRYRDLHLIIGDHALALLLIPVLRIPFIFDATDSHALYFSRRALSLATVSPLRAVNSLAWSKTYRAVEAIIARHAALYVVTAPEDRHSILAGFPHARVETVRNGTCWIDQPPIAPQISATAPVVAFHGGMTWEPNRSCATYLAKNVYPILSRSMPKVELHIAGGPMCSELAALTRRHGVVIAGFVQDLRAWLARCSVFAMPMTQGSGFKNKLIEAMAAGLPVVTNSLGAEALPKSCREGVVIADGRRALSQAILDLLRDRSRALELRAKARSIALREFGWSELAARYQKAVMTAGNCRSGGANRAQSSHNYSGR